MANKQDSYSFKFPNLIQHATFDYPKPLSEVIEILPDYQYDTSIRYEGMNEEVFDRQKKCLLDEYKSLLIFDSDFESGNLDKVILT